MNKKRQGRPLKEPNDLITYPMAVQAIREFLASKYLPEVVQELSLAEGTLRNKVAQKRLHAWHRGGRALVSRAEVIGLVS